MARTKLIEGRKYTLPEVLEFWTTKFDSQAEACRELGVNTTYWSHLLHGQRDNPSTDVLDRLGLTRLPPEYVYKGIE